MYLFVSHSISLLDKIVHLCFFNKIVFPLIKRTGHVKNHAVPFCALGDFQQASDMSHHVSNLLSRNSTEQTPKDLVGTSWTLRDKPDHSEDMSPSWKFLFIIFHSLCYIRDSIVFYYLILLPYK